MPKPNNTAAPKKLDTSFVKDTKFTVINPPKQSEPFVLEWAKAVIPDTNFGLNLAKDKDIVCNDFADVNKAKNANDGNDRTYWGTLLWLIS